MPTVRANGIDIAYEEHGSAGDPAMLLIQGLGMPLAGWPAPMIEGLAAGGFRIITFDNRDIGRSQLLRELKVPNMLVQTLRRKLRMKVKAPYQLTDMMRDTVGLLDALDIESAHVVGVSMGGMIAQLLAISEPGRVKSLTSIMSTTGNRKLPGPSKKVTRHVIRGPKARTDEARFEYNWKLWRLIGSPGYRLTDAELTGFLQGVFARGITAAGIARQTLAILATPERVPELKKLNVPTLVIHGDSDPLVPVECGKDTANAIPGSRIAIIEGMGHDLPIALIERLNRLIIQHARSTEITVAA